MKKSNTIQFPTFTASQNNQGKTTAAEKLLSENNSVYGEYKYQVIWAVIQYTKSEPFTTGKENASHYETVNSIFRLLESGMNDLEFLMSASTLIAKEKQKSSNGSSFENIVWPVIQYQINRLNTDTASAYMAMGCLSAIFSAASGFSKYTESSSKNLWFVAKTTAIVSAGVYLFGSLLRTYKPDLYAPLVRMGQTVDSPRVWAVSERLVGGTFRLILNQAERFANLLPEARPVPKLPAIENNVGTITTAAAFAK